MDIVIANPRGFCAGVQRAIDIVERALELFGAPIYVRHEVVHNKFVVDNLKARGAVFVEEIEEIPKNDAIAIFSAHGVSQSIRKKAKERGFKVFDATCPLVTKVHMEVARCSRRGEECILIGHVGHPEVEGTLGQYDNPNGGIYLIENEKDVDALIVKKPDVLAYVTQTTLSVDDTQSIIEKLKARFPAIRGSKKEDICYATQNRQDAVKAMAAECDVVLVVGSIASSNSNRLRELAERMGCQAYLIDNAEEIDPAWLTNAKRVGVTAGASAPEILVQGVIKRLQSLGGNYPEPLKGVEETIFFALPKELR